ncbi:MAG TPA: type II toxin-antitoxin system VapC family toxin [Hanamia sp.]
MSNAENYLLDSNTVIDYMEGKMPVRALEEMDKIIDQKAKISVITQMEILGWFGATSVQLNLLNEFVADAIVFDLTSEMINRTIKIRQQYKIKLPDAIIAATALVYDLNLLSLNIRDFKNIDGLKIINSHEL